MTRTLFDGPGTDIPTPLLEAARAFLDAADHTGGGGLRRCARVLIAQDQAQGGIVAVVAGQRLPAIDGQRAVSCLVVQQLRLARGWGRHLPLLRALTRELLRSSPQTLLLWAAPSARAHAEASRALPSLLPRFGERLPGATAAVRDRVMSRVEPHAWDPLRGAVCLQSRARVPMMRHVCVLRSSPLVVLRLLRWALQRLVRVPPDPALREAA